MNTQDFKIPVADYNPNQMGRKAKAKRNSQPREGFSGGYISREVLTDGIYKQRAIKNFPSDATFIPLISGIGQRAIEVFNSEGYEPSNEAKIIIYNSSGKKVILEITCTNRQAVEWSTI